LELQPPRGQSIQRREIAARHDQLDMIRRKSVEQFPETRDSSVPPPDYVI